jgi:hypothetical protein
MNRTAAAAIELPPPAGDGMRRALIGAVTVA